MSYHLRSLERFGVVRRSDVATDGRERPWQAAGDYLQVTPGGLAGPATGALASTALTHLGEDLARYLSRIDGEEEGWHNAIVSSAQLWAAPEDMSEIETFLEGLHARLVDRGRDDPPGARRIRLGVFAFPVVSSADSSAVAPADVPESSAGSSAVAPAVAPAGAADGHAVGAHAPRTEPDP